MGVLQVLQGISIVLLSLRKSLHDWQTRSGGRISRRRFFLLRPRLPPDLSPSAPAAALGGASVVIANALVEASGVVVEAGASAASTAGAGAGAPWAALSWRA